MLDVDSFCHERHREPCAVAGCKGTVTFDTGGSHALRGQPLRHSATCETCGTAQYLTESELHGVVPEWPNNDDGT